LTLDGILPLILCLKNRTQNGLENSSYAVEGLNCFFCCVILVDRLKTMLEDLSSYGLARKLAAQDQTLYFATPRGLEFLDTYWKMKGFIEIFGDQSKRK
jgi:hypothetical protein